MEKPRLHYGWIVIFMGLLVTIGAHGFGRMSYTLILPAMKDGLRFTYTQLGLIGTGNFIGYLSMALIGGALAARFGCRLMIFLALAFMGITMLLTGLARNFEMAFMMRLLTGLGHGAAYVPAMALGSAWFATHRRGFATGIVSAGIGLGTMIASLIIPQILKAQGLEGWRFAWHYLGAAVIGIAVLAALFIRSRPEEMGLCQIGAEPASTALPPGSPPPAKALRWREVYRVKSIWYLGLVYFMYGFSYIIYMTFFAAYLIKELGLTPAKAGALWALVGGLSIFCGVLWGGISDYLGRARGAALAYLSLAVAYLLFAFIKTPAGYYLSVLFFGLSAWSIPTIMAATAGDIVGPRLAPAGLGLVTLFFGIGQALGPSVGGYLSDSFKTFSVPFLLATGVSLLGGLMALGIKVQRK
ncbi:MAG TPA: MFS transporter [Thermodesulfobacteriota bacterium]|nr:MFS transporter [Thermodesulfobacteriota bacterium]